MLTPVQTLVTILAIAAATMLTRFLPFVLFPDHKDPPATIAYLGNALPPAVIGLLVVYCLKGVSIAQPPHGLPEALAVAAIVLLHLKWRNTLLSIGAGTVCYMLLVQTIF